MSSRHAGWHPVLAVCAAAVVVFVATRVPSRKPADLSASQPATTRPGSTRPAPGAAERVAERELMVQTQIAEPDDGRIPVRERRVLDAVRAVPRHAFVPEAARRMAYLDTPLPIGSGQTISQPYIVALMTELLQVTPESKVLEIGTGSGYQAAVLAQLTSHVYSIEIIPELAREANRSLHAQGYTEVHLRTADGYLGWPEAAPFDGIIVTCAADDIPGPLWDQLKPGGRMVIPTGDRGFQELVVVSKTMEGKRESRTIIPVRFVPLVRSRPG